MDLEIGDTVIIDEESFDNIRIKVGGMELNVDPDEIDRDFDHDDLELKEVLLCTRRN